MITTSTPCPRCGEPLVRLNDKSTSCGCRRCQITFSYPGLIQLNPRPDTETMPIRRDYSKRLSTME